MKKRKLKKGVKISLIVIGSIILLITLLSIAKGVKNRQIEEEKQLVNDYIQCLEENHIQRYYCSQKVSNTDYRILDQLIKKYGYEYKQVKKDLQLIKK